MAPPDPEFEASAKAGWYPDPEVPGQLRFWNGNEWRKATKQARNRPAADLSQDRPAVDEPEPQAAPGWYPDTRCPAQLRFWDGAQWTPETQRVTPDARRAAIDRVVGEMVGHSGWRVESRTDYQAVLVSGHRTNHILHLLLTLLTFGLWAVVWLIIGLTNKEKRDVVTVDEYAQISHQY